MANIVRNNTVSIQFPARPGIKCFGKCSVRAIRWTILNDTKKIHNLKIDPLKISIHFPGTWLSGNKKLILFMSDITI